MQALPSQDPDFKKRIKVGFQDILSPELGTLIQNRDNSTAFRGLEAERVAVGLGFRV